MRSIDKIYDYVTKKCSDDNCQSIPIITKICMEEAVRDTLEDIVEELETLQDYINNGRDKEFKERFDLLVVNLINRL